MLQSNDQLTKEDIDVKLNERIYQGFKCIKELDIILREKCFVRNRMYPF